MKEAEYIQFSWFSNEFVNQDIEQIYQGLVGTIADASHKNNNVSPAQPFLCLANGNSDGLNCMVRFDHQRLDLVVKKIDDGVPPIGSLIDVNASLFKLIEKVSNFNVCGIKSVNRLALSINLCDLSKKMEDSNKIIFEMCPLKISSNSTSDLFFRFNRRKDMNNLCQINRFAIYLVSFIERLILNNKKENVDKDDYFILNVLLDFNTVSEPNRILENQMHKRIWNGFSEEIIKFVENPNVMNLE